MVQFHRQRRSGQSVSQAARETGRAILTRRRAAGLSTSPTTWAGFVATDTAR
jgi:hypothetical protein